MKIAVINKKGGVGKTPFAFSIAKDLNMYLQSTTIVALKKFIQKWQKFQMKL